MVRLILIAILFSLSLCVSAQNGELLPELLKSYPSASPSQAVDKMNEFVARLETKRAGKTDEEFLSLLFRDSHRRFFKKYEPYTQFSQVFENGQYDCLSATSFLSVVLEKFDFEYRIIETNYHIFIVINTSAGEVLIESTDRMNGLVTEPKEIDSRINSYRLNEFYISMAPTNKDFYKFNLNLFQEVEPRQLPGLLYFNQAVIAFNNNDLVDCALRLTQSKSIYESPRTAEFALILVKSVLVSNLDDDLKKDLIRPFAKYLVASASAVASR
ncbi:MAG: hypothetical protein JNL53_18890 [Cyclobacteriaceae bacterium]|nr:hypothetical protein [Cyclobacteriaceae bacterium]